MGAESKGFSFFHMPAAVFFAIILLTASGCSKSPTSIPKAQVPAGVKGTESIEALSARIPEGQTGTTRLSNQAILEVHKLNNRLFYPVEATFTSEEFTRLRSQSRDALEIEIGKTLKQLHSAQAIDLNVVAEWGYFSFLLPYGQDLLAPLKTIRFENGFIFNPLVIDRESLRAVRSFTPASEGLAPRSMNRNGNQNYSGLERIHALEFVRKARESIGSSMQIDGSTVKVGITDTGITYSHPTFDNADGSRSRIVYMKDFTREGRVYFNPGAKFEAKASATSEGEVIITAEFIKGLKLPSLPKADEFETVNETSFKVSPAIRELLLKKGTSVRLGYILEADFQSTDDKVDLNRNGARDDRFAVFFIRGKSFPDDSVIYVDFTGKNDFTKARALRDFNLSQDHMDVHAEKIGFDFKEERLPAKDGKSAIPVLSASIVGYDPGNHGTHVGGIAAGRKTISNDSDDTLARGVAPNAQIHMNRVCSNNAGCSATQALIDFALNTQVKVINMSLGGLSPFNDGSGVQETLINRLTLYKNILFVISAGNSGPGRQTVGSPSTARLSLSVGATATQGMIQKQYQYPGALLGDSTETDLNRDFMLFFSSRGPTAAGGFKPNLSAPGTELSAIQLNTAPGALGGLAVYWGTSMAAPTVTGAYALLLDGINKYNAAHPEAPMTTSARELRRVLIGTARPFDVSSFEPITGKKTEGRYTWADQGTGMLDLSAAWDMLLEMSRAPMGTAVSLNNQPLELDYQVLVPQKSPDGTPYDGTRLGDENAPIFGSGIYLSPQGTESLRKVHVLRRIPENLQSSPAIGDLSSQLDTTQDEFEIRTTIYGSDQIWLKAGVMDILSLRTRCRDLPAGNLIVLGRGAEVGAHTEKGSEIVPLDASTLNICLDRRMIARELKPGDHGALISAYRKINGKVAPIASFTVPVFITIPHQSLAGSKAYEIQGSVNSFEVSRNYLRVPVGTSVLMLTLEVPAIKQDIDGVIAEGQHCSGVELMALEGQNTAKSFEKRADSRIYNCDLNGNPTAEKRVLTLHRSNPRPGVWDLHLFGSYKFERSEYKLRVDYLTSASSITKIEGPTSALNGRFSWSIQESSVSVGPATEKSVYSLDSLLAESEHQVKTEKILIVPSSRGATRTYPANTLKVTLTTGQSPGNDIDLIVIGCPKDATSLEDPRCRRAGESTHPADTEKVSFVPKADWVYAMAVMGYAIKDEGKFLAGESISFQPENGNLQITPDGNIFSGTYGFTPAQIGRSTLLQNPLFISGQFQVTGTLMLKTEQGGVLDVIPVRINTDFIEKLK